MRDPDEPTEADTCPRCGETQVLVDRKDGRVRLACPACQYEVTRLDPSRVRKD